MSPPDQRTKVAVVTGASSGIGACVARAMAGQGSHVVLVARDAARLQETRKAIEASGGSAETRACDVTDASGVDALARGVMAAHGRVDWLVNAAGVYYPTPIGATPVADLDRMLLTNLRAPMLLCGAFAPGMAARGYGVIVNVASVAAVLTVSGHAAYCATKAGLAMYTRALAREMAGKGVRANVVAPGNTATPMNESVRADPALVAAFAAVTPSRRVFSPPEEMAGVVLFLLSDAAAACHGSVLVADEGLSLGL